MQRQVFDGHAGGAQRLVERRREVQTGGRRRGRTTQACVDRLVTLGVVKRRLDVGRQRRLAIEGQQVSQRHGDARRGAHPKTALAETLTDLHGKGFGRGLAAQQLAAAQPTARQDFPGVG